MEMVSSFMDSAFGSRRQGDDYIRAVLMHLANHGYELDSYSKRGDEASSFRTNTFHEIRRLVDGKNVLFVRRVDAYSVNPPSVKIFFVDSNVDSNKTRYSYIPVVNHIGLGTPYLK